VRQPPRDPFDRLLDRCEWIGDCLVWTGTGARQYGTFRPGSKPTDPKAYVHRWIYENTVGPIPEGHEVDHVADRGCTSKRCINPDHLEPVVHRTNMERARLTVCRSGRHDLTDPDNQVWDRNGNRRGCAACVRERAARRERVGQ
jgi:hypothetical protein